MSTGDIVVLTSQAEFRMRLHTADTLPELVGRSNVNLIEDETSPLA